MAKMNIDEEGLLDEPCLSCKKAYIEFIWYEWCCDEKECPYNAESGGNVSQGFSQGFSQGRK